MIFKLHYFCLTSGACAVTILLGVFMETYTDASSAELGAFMMVMPFTGIISRPLICSMADRAQAHRKYLLECLLVVSLCYSPFIIIPYLGIHEEHPRLCWYVLVIFKIIGDIALGGVISIGDALAMNYAKRIGTEFSVYRIWGTVAWMSFGLVIGQINEVPFMPKYVPAFMILIGSTLLNMTVIWLWPKEYFEMKALDLKDEQEDEDKAKSDKKESAIMKSLMPREVVLNRMKNKIVSLFIRRKSTSPSITQTTETTGDSSTKEISTPSQPQIDKRTQIVILRFLLCRDPRIILYIIFFICTGFTIIPLTYFFISLSNICHEKGTCKFSELTGYLQVSMASIETVFFIYIKPIKSVLGRVNLCIAAMMMFSVKYLFYGIYYSQVSPYYALISEMLHGVAYAINLVLMIETAHMFANEVQYILPELMSKGAITDSSPASVDRLKLSLSATMQALMCCASEGLGRGFGALIYGIFLEHYTYETMWLVIGIGSAIITLITIMIKLFDYVLKPNLGLDVKAKLSKNSPGKSIN